MLTVTSDDVFLPVSFTLNGEEGWGSVSGRVLDDRGGDVASMLPEGATGIVVYRGEAAARRRAEMAERMVPEPPTSDELRRQRYSVETDPLLLAILGYDEEARAARDAGDGDAEAIALAKAAAARGRYIARKTAIRAETSATGGVNAGIATIPDMAAPVMETGGSTEAETNAAGSTNTAPPENLRFVTSADKYHLPDCPFAKTGVALTVEQLVAREAIPCKRCNPPSLS